MKRTQNGDNRILIILLISIISMSISACSVGNGTENIVTASGITDEHTMSKEAYEESSANLNDILRTAAVLFGTVSNGADQMSSVVNTVINNNSMSFALSAVSQTADQIAAAVVKRISSSI